VGDGGGRGGGTGGVAVSVTSSEKPRKWSRLSLIDEMKEALWEEAV